MDNFLNLPFFEAKELEQLEHYQSDLGKYQENLLKFKEQLKKQTNSEIAANLQKDIKELEINIFTIISNSQNLVNKIYKRVENAVDKRLKDLDENTYEYKILERLKKDLSMVISNTKVDYLKLKKVYEKYNNIKSEYENINHEIIKKCQERLIELEKNYNQNKTVTNNKGSLTDNGIIILSKDVIEYNSLLKMMKLLEDRSLDMVYIANNIYLKKENIVEFQYLASKTILKDDVRDKTDQTVVERVASLDLAHVAFVIPDDIAKKDIEQRANFIEHDSTLGTREPVKIELPTSFDLGNFLSDKEVLLRAVDKYVEKKKNNELKEAHVYRDMIMKKVGLNIDDYVILKKDLDSLRHDIVKYLEMDEESYQKYLASRIKELEMLLNEALLPSRELQETEHDIYLLNEELSEVKSKKR